MGNHHGHGTKSGTATPNSCPGSRNGSRKSISRTASGGDIQEKPSQMLPTEKTREDFFQKRLKSFDVAQLLFSSRPMLVVVLASFSRHIQIFQKMVWLQILADKAHKEEGANGVTLKVFTRYLFPRYPDLAEKLFTYFHANSKSKNSYIGTSAFRQQCDNYLAILDDDVIRNTLVKMWSSPSQDGSSDTMTPESLTSLLKAAYHISMDHYAEGPQSCISVNKTLKAVVDSCFHGKQSLSSQFVSHWIESNTPRLLFPLHRYAVHSLATSWRTLEETNEPTLAAVVTRIRTDHARVGTTEPIPPGQRLAPHMLTMSMSWLLAGALPPLYSRPQKAHSPNNSGVGLASTSFLAKLVCAIPSHWQILYDSDEMGLGSNRFLHHVLNYKGATLTVLRVENAQKFCIASPNEWRESHHYWGGEEGAVFQLLPNFLERGSKMLYLNLSVRGYPQGLRVGKDPRAPILSIDGGFEKIDCQKVPYRLESIEVWGCGDQVSRERQLEVKKWEVKEAERQRNVKLSAADWLDHPDRYLLELAGRPQYHQNQT
ncbi:hypothetical protein NQ318_017495 [Aromia moschata]|uniref:TLDc domain-containing protein n=1 Tax=Aromia moschata TaxID=1265417 RepID=A0AAV8XPM5_9CUCU|nr:hypothetical protein NQ318_017495 [Aromia moschata]